MSKPDRFRLTDRKFAEPLGERPLLDFTARIFVVGPAMVRKRPVNGHRLWTRLDPERFNEDDYEIVEGKWDHEDCVVCWTRISPGDEYWENSERHVLCAACHAELQKLC